MIYYVFKWMKILWKTVSFFSFYLFLSCFSLLSAFLFSKLFRNNLMHWKIIDCYFNVFFVEIQLKKKTWKVDFGCQSMGVILLGGGGGEGVILLGGHVILKKKLKLHNTSMKIFGITYLIYFRDIWKIHLLSSEKISFSMAICGKYLEHSVAFPVDHFWSNLHLISFQGMKFFLIHPEN